MSANKTPDAKCAIDGGLAANAKVLAEAAKVASGIKDLPRGKQLSLDDMGKLLAARPIIENYLKGEGLSEAEKADLTKIKWLKVAFDNTFGSDAVPADRNASKFANVADTLRDLSKAAMRGVVGGENSCLKEPLSSPQHHADSLKPRGPVGPRK